MAKATYTEERNASPCRLTREDVVTLAQIVRTGFDDERSFFGISTELPTAKVKAVSVEDFFQSNLLPDTLQQLSLYCSDRSASSKDRLIHIYFSSTSTSVEVVGEDHEWAVGRCEGIARFLKERRPWYWPLIRYFELLLPQLLVVSIFFTAIFFPRYISGNTVSQILYYVFLAVYWIVYGCRWFGVLSRTKIYVRTKMKNDARTQTQLAMIGVAVGILAVIVPVILWLIDQQNTP